MVDSHINKDLNAAFVERLKQACDDSTAIPEFGKGRQIKIANELGVSQEAVRKWFSGEAKPKTKKTRRLAELLNVNHSWLELGEDSLRKDQKKLAGCIASAPTMFVGATIAALGGHVAYDTKEDVHVTAIIQGIHFDIHVAWAEKIDLDSYELLIPRNFEELRCVGYIPDGKDGSEELRYDLIDLPLNLISRNKENSGRGGYRLVIERTDDRYFFGGERCPRFNPRGGCNER